MTAARRAAQMCLESSCVAQLDDGALWPTAFAILEWNDEVEARVADLIKRAVG